MLTHAMHESGRHRYALQQASHTPEALQSVLPVPQLNGGGLRGGGAGGGEGCGGGRGGRGGGQGEGGGGGGGGGFAQNWQARQRHIWHCR